MRKLLWGVVMCCMLFPGVGLSSAQNSRLEKLLLMLKDNGTITQEQYETLMEAAEPIGQEAFPEAALPGEVSNEGVIVKTRGGLEVESPDGRFSFRLGGRLFLDGAAYVEDRNRMGDGTELRSARIGVEGRLFEDWGYEFDVDFAGGSEIEVKDAYLRYDGFSGGKIVLGQFKEPFSLEELTSSRYITFMERALPNELAPGRHMGAGLYRYGGAWTFSGGLFGESFDNGVEDEGNDGWGATGRVTFAPFHQDDRVLHLGAAASWRKPDQENEKKFSARPESHVTDVKYLNTGKIKEVDHESEWGLEAAVVHGPFSLQGEYIRAHISRDNGYENADFDGWYIYASWFPTGENRRYKFKKGAFGRVKPLGEAGAVELALRFSALDLNDGSIKGGNEENVTFGLNWYLNSHIRCMANYSLINNDSHGDDDGDVLGDDDLRIFQARFQLDF